MFLIDIKNGKKQLLDEQAAMKVIEKDFDKINQITTLQETTMKYRIKLQDDRKFLVESSRMESFLDEYFPIMESLEIEEAVDWEKTGFYPCVYSAESKKPAWYGKEVFDLDDAIEICSVEAEKRAQAKGNEYFGKVIDSDGLIAYTEVEGESVNKKYLEQEEDDAADGELNAEEEKTFADAAKLEKPATAEIDPETGEKIEAGSFVDTIKDAYRQHKKALEKKEQDKKLFLDKIEKGEISRDYYDANIKMYDKEIQDIRRLMKDDLAKLDQAIAKRDEEQAKAERHHEELKQRYGMEHTKDARMAAAAKPVQSFSSLKDLLAARLNKQAAPQPTDEKAR